ncbi:perlucin-like protein isoform X2 [Argopecten irradians]|uniref:perlucin-like protein isoform X2 n=1 Tax=Argopecten irradians TaxID=31199 RepID=UPI00372437ED
MATLRIVLLLLMFTTAWSETKAAGYVQCPQGWRRHQDTCHLFVTNHETWTEHMQHCVQLGAHLATINDEREDKYLEAEVHKRNASFWVGGTNMNNNKTWIWIEDNSPVHMGPCGTGHSYCAWNRGVPDNSHDNEHCLELNLRTHWNDNYCLVLQGAVCETKPKPEYHWITVG